MVEFFDWCERRGFDLETIEAVVVAAYIEELGRSHAAPSVKQYLAAIRMLFDWLVVSQIVPHNPAAAVRGPKHSIKRGKTLVLSAKEARQLLDSIPLVRPHPITGEPVADVVALRDRALIATMVYSFARVSAVVGMRVEDYYRNGKRFWNRLHEKGGKLHEVPAHHQAEEYMDAYLRCAAMDLVREKKTPLFRSASGRSHRLSANGMTRKDALAMVKRRACQAGLPASTCCHTFRATGITAYLENGGTIENAQAIAAHESSHTTKLYDRTSDEITLEEVERIRI